MATVGGIVFEDLDADGMRGADEPAATGVMSVVAETVEGVPVAFADVDPDGSFLIDVSPGSYLISPILYRPRVTTTASPVTVNVAADGVDDLGFGVSSCLGWKVAKLLNPNPGEDDGFGYSVDIDGDRLVVDTQRGDVYVYTRTSPGWVVERIREAGSDTYRSGGITGAKTVAISGSTIVIGDGLSQAAGYQGGAVYLYELDGETWTANLLLPDGLQRRARLGHSVAIDGLLVAAGAPNDSLAAFEGVYSGAAYVFELVGSEWESTRLQSPEPEPWNWFGSSVAIAGDAVVVSEAVAFEESTAGSVYVFAKSGTEWTPRLIARSVEHQLGWSVAGQDGMVVAGAPQQGTLAWKSEPGVPQGVGYAEVILGTADGYITERFDPNGGLVRDRFGYAIDANAERLVVGSPGALSSRGAAYVYELPREGSDEMVCTGWDLGQWDGFGRSVAIDGSTMVVGAPGHDDPVKGSGAIYVFEVP